MEVGQRLTRDGPTTVRQGGLVLPIHRFPYKLALATPSQPGSCVVSDHTCHRSARRTMLSLVRWGLFVLLLPLTSESRAQAPDHQSPAASEFAEPLRPGDVIRLQIWREPDLSGDFTV